MIFMAVSSTIPFFISFLFYSLYFGYKCCTLVFPPPLHTLSPSLSHVCPLPLLCASPLLSCIPFPPHF